MSLRLRILLAFAYGFLLILVALEVPLALNLSRRVDAEVRSDAAGEPRYLHTVRGVGFRFSSPDEVE